MSLIITPGTPTTNSSGSFVVGTEALLFYYFVDVGGQLYDPSDLAIVITDSSGTTLVESDSMDKVEHGCFAFKFTIRRATVPGAYTSTVTYIVETINGPSTESFSEDFVIIESGPGDFTIRQVASRGHLESLIGYTQRIPMFNEIVIMNKNKTKGELSFPRWNQTAPAKVFINGQIKESGYTVDYNKGWIEFAHTLSQHDEITMNYNFRWFTNDELDGFLEQGVNMLNAYPPMTAYHINNIPDRWMIIMLYSAAIDVLRRWMMDVQFQEPVKIFGATRFNDVFNHMDTLKKNYEGWLDKLLEKKKFIPYLGRTKTFVTPTYTLPGGRCFSKNTNITILDKTGKEKTVTIEEAYNTYGENPEISVISQFDEDTDDNLYSTFVSFAKVFKIWKSGVKNVYEVTTKSGKKAFTSEEHLFFVSDKYIPLKEVSIGDEFTCIDYSLDEIEVFQDEVVSIEHVGMDDTYDIEVPETKNLFANGIKCHNSRWFRYLFKGG